MAPESGSIFTHIDIGSQIGSLYVTHSDVPRVFIKALPL